MPIHSGWKRSNGNPVFDHALTYYITIDLQK